MNDYGLNQESYSLCIACVTEQLSGRFFMYYRVADYTPSDGSQLKVARVEKDFRDRSARNKHPDFLYSPQIAQGYDTRKTDLSMLAWWPSSDDPQKTLCREADPNLLLRQWEPKEVIIADGIRGEYELREAIAAGIPFPWLTTRVFYLVFDSDAKHYFAARCEVKDFDFSRGKMSLKPKASNFRTGLSVPVVLLEKNRVIRPAFDEIADRGVYAEMAELPEVSRFLLRPLRVYAPEYVNWFARQQNKGITRSERQKLVPLIEEALKRPDLIEEYVKADAPELEIHEFLKAIVSLARSEEDPVRQQIRDELLKDKVFYELCREEVIKESSETLRQNRRELDKLNEEASSVRSLVEDRRQALEKLDSVIEGKTQDLNMLEEQLDGHRSELSHFVAIQEEALDEIEANAALRLGLRAIASQRQEAQPQTIIAQTDPLPSHKPELLVSSGAAVEGVKGVRSTMQALEKNLASYGLRAFFGSSDEQRKLLALSVVAAFATTKCLAMPASLALATANAISVALYGSTATRVFVPTEHKDVSGILDAVEGADGVVLLENVIDPVNEGLLFALLERAKSVPVVFSFTSHASAALLAKEAWEKMFFPACESLVAVGDVKSPRRLYMATENDEIRIGIDESIDRMREIADEFSELSLSASALLLPARVLEAADRIDDWDLTIVMQHLMFALGNTQEYYDSIEAEDDGLNQLAIRLLHEG